MPDIGWSELFLIAVVTLIVVGPKEIPRVLRTVSQWGRKIKEMAREFQSGIDDLAREADMEDFRKEIEDAEGFDVKRNIEEMIDPTGEYARSVQDMEGSVESTLGETPEIKEQPSESEQLDDNSEQIDDVPAKTAGA